MDEPRLFVFKMWRVLLSLLVVCVLPGYIDADTVNAWAWVSLGSLVLICGLLWLRRLPPSGMYLLMLLANAANTISNAQEGNWTSMVFCGAVACGCVWWAWEARNDPSEHTIVKRVAAEGEG